MSAFCSTDGTCCMSGDAIKSCLPSITARPTREEKLRFAELAAARYISESKLALIAIRDLLDSNAAISLRATPSANAPAIDRITVRLRPGDRRAVMQRAARRGMKDSTYLAALVRAHIAANPPLAANELAALKVAVSVLAGFGRLLVRTAREAAQTGALPKDLQQDLSRTRALVSSLEARVHELARVALVSWESRLD